MKKIKLTGLGILLTLAIQQQLIAQQSWTTQISPDNSSEIATKLIKTQDGGFVTVLYDVDAVINTPQNTAYTKIAIVKLDNSGDTVFYKKINIKDSSYVRINDFIEIPTGELLLNGVITTVTSNDTTRGSLLIKTTNMGDTLWTRINYNHISTEHGNHNLVGFAFKFWTVDAILTGPFDTLDYFIYEYDYNGNLLNVNYQDTMVRYGSFTAKPKLYKDINDSVLIRGNWKGEGLLQKKIDTLFNTYTYPLPTTIAIISANGNMADGANNLWIVTGQGDSIWQHDAVEYKFSWGAGTSQANTNICNTSDGGYAIIGNTWNALVNNIYLIKTDALGNKQFGEMYWSVTDHNIDVLEANDGGFVMMNTGTGTIFSNQSGAGIWIVKTDANGIITGIDDTKFFKDEIKIYPNPSRDKINIEFANSKEVEIAIYTITGIQVYLEKLNNSKTHQLNIEHLPQGMYILHATQPNKIITKKFIKN